MKKIQYHSHNSISASGLKTIYKKSVYHLINQRFKETPAMALGTAVHAAILESDDFYKDDPNEYGLALILGHVDFGEEYSKDKIIIVHSLKKSEGLYSHNVFYFSPSMAEFVNAKNESDF